MSPSVERANTVLAMRPAYSFGEIARATGLTRSVVAGIVYRHRKRPASKAKLDREEPKTKHDDAILILMSDGRIRTTTEIAFNVGGIKNTIRCAVKRLERLGLLELVQRERGNYPAIWREREVEA